MLEVGPVHIDPPPTHFITEIVLARFKKTHEMTVAHHPKWSGNSAGKYTYMYMYHEYAHIIYMYICCIPKG